LKKQYLKRIFRLFFGLSLCGVSMVFTLQANIGVSSWAVLHQGLSNTVGITYGNASIVVGLTILLIDILLRERFGLGTISNIIFIGKFSDLLLYLDIIPYNESQNVFIGLLMICLAICLMAFGSFFYIGAGLGSGPRDSLMVGLTRRLKKVPVGVIRSSLECFAIVSGWLLGGQVGIGTVVSMLGTGFMIQTVFKLFNFQVSQVYPEPLMETLKNLFSKTKISAE